MKMKIQNYFVLLIIVVAFFYSSAQAQIASGGSYTLEKSVTANGGVSGATASAGGNYTLEGTIGQFAVGTQSQNAPFTFLPGFWTPPPLAPTSASVSLGGRVLEAKGRGIKNVRIVLTMPGGETRTAISSPFGYYRFDNVPVGETYILTAYARRFVFSSPTQIVTLFEVREDIDFIAETVFLQ
jgi:hypothetical protein